MAATREAIEAEVREKYPSVVWLIAIPEVWEKLVAAVAEGWTPEKLATEIQQTTWWRTTEPARRSWDQLVNTDPAAAQARRAEQRANLSDLGSRLGVAVDPERFNAIIEDSLRFGWSQTQIIDALVSNLPSGPQTTIGGARGAYGSTGDQLRTIAQGQYLVDLTDPAYLDWSRQILAGEATVDDFTRFAKDQAKARWPGLVTSIDQGLTVRQAVAPYEAAITNILGVAPASIDFRQPRWGRALDSVTPNGGRSAMAIWEWERLLRSDPSYGYQFTPGAADQAAQLATFLGEKMGSVG